MLGIASNLESLLEDLENDQDLLDEDFGGLKDVRKFTYMTWPPPKKNIQK